MWKVRALWPSTPHFPSSLAGAPSPLPSSALGQGPEWLPTRCLSLHLPPLWGRQTLLASCLLHRRSVLPDFSSNHSTPNLFFKLGGINFNSLAWNENLSRLECMYSPPQCYYSFSNPTPPPFSQPNSSPLFPSSLSVSFSLPFFFHVFTKHLQAPPLCQALVRCWVHKVI